MSQKTTPEFTFTPFFPAYAEDITVAVGATTDDTDVDGVTTALPAGVVARNGCRGFEAELYGTGSADDTIGWTLFAYDAVVEADPMRASTPGERAKVRWRRRRLATGTGTLGAITRMTGSQPTATDRYCKTLTITKDDPGTFLETVYGSKIEKYDEAAGVARLAVLDLGSAEYFRFGLWIPAGSSATAANALVQRFS